MKIKTIDKFRGRIVRGNKNNAENIFHVINDNYLFVFLYVHVFSVVKKYTFNLLSTTFKD